MHFLIDLRWTQVPGSDRLVTVFCGKAQKKCFCKKVTVLKTRDRKSLDCVVRNERALLLSLWNANNLQLYAALQDAAVIVLYDAVGGNHCQMNCFSWALPLCLYLAKTM